MGDFFMSAAKKIFCFLSYLSKKKAATLTGALAYFLFAGFLPFLSALAMAAKLFGAGEELFLKTLGGAFGVAVTLAESDISSASGTASITVTAVFFAVISVYSSSKFCVHLGETGKLLNMKNDDVKPLEEEFEKEKTKTKKCRKNKQTRKEKNGEKQIKLTAENQRKSAAVLKIIKRLLAAGVTFSAIGIFLAAMVAELFGSAVLSLLSFPPALVKAVYYVAGVFLNAALCVILVRYATKNGGEKSYFKGAVLCFFVWECVGLLFSLREKFFGTGSGLATAALLSLYLYFMMFGVVAGAGLNFYLADDVRKQSVTFGKNN